MVRKAETLKSLDELNVSTKTCEHLKKHYSTDVIIKITRNEVYNFNNSFHYSELTSELMSAIEEAGFIRPKTDFTMSFCIGALYNAIFPNIGESFITEIEQLSNEQYESFVGVSDEDIERVKLALIDRLTKREYMFICRCFGLDGGDEYRGYEPLAQHFNVTEARARQIVAKAIRELRDYNTLPALFDAPSGLNEAIDELRGELDRLHENPAFKREREILNKLEIMEILPLRYFDQTNGRFSLSGLLDFRSVRKLNLSIHMRRCLRRAEIYTISDVANYPKNAWRAHDKRFLEVLVEKMHSAGYEDFDIGT